MVSRPSCITETVKLAEYLFTHLSQLGVHSIYGVGSCNELDAGYAADAYARLKGLGALTTTLGVGELSALNAIAGAHAELAPVSGVKIHRTLNDGNFRHFADMYGHVTVAQVNLTDPSTCPEMIDTAIQQGLMHSRPVYIEVPTDMVAVSVCAERLNSRIEIAPAMPSQSRAAALSLPMVLVDGESRACRILDEIQELITTFGKSCVDESLPNVHGIWKGEFWACENDKSFVALCDLVLCFGPHFSSTNTYDFTSIPGLRKSIVFAADRIEVFDRSFRDISCKGFLSKLLQQLDLSKVLSNVVVPGTDVQPSDPSPDPSSGRITQAEFCKRFNRFLQPGDMILAETGTASYGCRDFELPPHTTLFKPVTWLSIGYMLPAAQAVPRTILLIGDGSFQMTIQELSTIIREKLNVFIVLIYNEGYTIERCLHGWDRQYNDVASWKYLMAPAFFGADMSGNAEYGARTIGDVRTWQDLDKVLDKPFLGMIEVFLDREDAPDYLRSLLEKQKQEARSAA
ncbi:putative pyruvate decarboxylase [Polychaeton citri CBS 116435]|uniref:Pyruvate decarboxylase n=1 Tax=Polychaeton citri CBS 116435 TaxID=1314669 RepID=A0A9P4UNW8_9PEZI|nr:putative pyruvate decarboxylase [Polychaeton citri CBS 116435]